MLEVQHKLENYMNIDPWNLTMVAVLFGGTIMSRSKMTQSLHNQKVTMVVQLAFPLETFLQMITRQKENKLSGLEENMP